MITNKQEIIQNNKEFLEIDHYTHCSYVIYDKEKLVNNAIWRMYSAPIFFVSIVGAASIAYVGLTIDDGSFSLGTYAALVALSGMLTSTVIKITQAFNDITKSYTHVEKLWDFMDNGPVAKNINSGPDFNGSEYNIVLSHIYFGYEDVTVLKDLSLHIDGGTKVALVGPSGGGKSTIVKLVAGYLRPDS